MWYVIQTVTGKERELVERTESVLFELKRRYIKAVLSCIENASGESKASFGFILNR